MKSAFTLNESNSVLKVEDGKRLSFKKLSIQPPTTMSTNLILAFIVISWLTKSATCFQIDSSCRCVLFNSTYDKDYGIFHSPNWPAAYADDIGCLLYTFQGKDDQIVEITFDEFDLQRNNLE